jgi:hypothetical protein
VADQGRIAVVYSKFYFGPYLDTALANNTAMGIRLKMIDVSRMQTVDHGDPGLITASDQGGERAAAALGAGPYTRSQFSST